MNHSTLSEKTQPTLAQAQESNAAQLRELTLAVIQSAGLTAEKSHEVAEKLHAELRERWGGQRVYFHKISLHQAQARRDYVIKHWNGRNTEEIVKETGLSRRSVYAISAQARARVQSLA